jgi:short-subunit dehydrogenase
VVWITGASSGIGEALVYEFVRQGARLAISSRNEAELQRVKTQCPPRSEVEIFPLDVTDYKAVNETAQAIIQRFGYVSILVANAGVSQRSLVKDTALEVDQRIMGINYFGAVAATKAILPSMIRQQFGQVVVISSVLGKIGTPLRSAYAASKHALHGFFDSLRAEVYADNIKVTIICPGYVRTNVTINALRGDGTPLNKMAEETASGMSPEAFARRALRAIAAGREEPIIGSKEVLAIYIKRLFPGLFSKLIRHLKFG